MQCYLIGKIRGDIAVIADIAYKCKGPAGNHGFDNVRAVFHAAAFDTDGFIFQGVMLGIFGRQRLAIIIVGTGFAPEAGFISVQVECFTVLEKPVHVIDTATDIALKWLRKWSGPVCTQPGQG